MASPTPYARAQNFTNWQSSNPGVDFNGTDLDSEFNAVLASLNAAISNLNKIQRADGGLANGIVGRDQLSSSVVQGINTPVTWGSGVAYTLRDSVLINSIWYWCKVAHTSGTFATDLAAGDWKLIFDFTSFPGQVASAGLTSFAAAAAAAAANKIIYFTAANVIATVDLQANAHLFAIAGGTADALTATLAPVPAAYSDGMEIAIRASLANATTTPTLNLNGEGARTITKKGNQVLVAGDIVGNRHELILRRAGGAGPRWELLNPRGLIDDSSAANARTSLGLGTAATLNVGTGASQIVQRDGAGAYPAGDGSAIAGIGSGIPTGARIGYFGTTAPSGWVVAGGGTIGDASSGGTERANADTSALFTLVWGLADSLRFPILDSTGATSTFGASAAADFAAHKRITLPDFRGRVGAGKDDMGVLGAAGRMTSSASPGIDGTKIGSKGGEQEITITAAQSGVPAHTHTLTNGANVIHTNGAGVDFPDGAGAGSFSTVVTTVSGAANATASAASAHSNTQPTIIETSIIKL